PGGQLRLDAEPVLLQGRSNALNDVAPEDLVARFHVGELKAREEVGKSGQGPVAERMPPGLTAARLDRFEARAEHHVGPVVQNRLEKSRIVGGVVFEIGILYEDNFAFGPRETGAQGRSFAAIVRVEAN